ncbi:uncharacterized protein Tco025E_07637 [Trypanosoma conorhini]|uniref:Uncharacterized protein n=1 Tax=Trypanosoma conorhini TaxID=83891 RepID=A0A3R7RKX7_9TRYP|nr:uncharacterized protein Tco025E_07637 [Trypanosoma conorhini]RNF06213.1 hypothetical protein Tco025E_07637 [Trypanosoma conorhini]
MADGMNNGHSNGHPTPNPPAEARALSSAASTAFWLTGVTCVAAADLQPVCRPRHGLGEKIKEEDEAVEVKQDEARPAHEQGRCRNGSGGGQCLGSASAAAVAWLRREEAHGAHRGGNGHSRGGTVPHSSSSSSPSRVPVHVVEETVMCNLVPLLPRTHAQLGLVTQIVPCTLWPPPADDARATSRATSLQQAAGMASGLHCSALRGSGAPASFLPSSPAALPGALVEWSTGGVGYTADTEGLWAEQRVVLERYHHLPPLVIDCDARHKGDTAGDTADGDAVGLRTPPSTLTGAVREQLRRFCCLQQERRSRNDLGEWVLCFARLVPISYELAVVLEQLTSQSGTAGATAVAGSRAAAEMLPACDALLDEMFLIGIVPSGEPHRLSLVCPSEAHRRLTEQQRLTPKPRPSVAESLMEMMTLALRESLCRRIGVQYELLRILRVKALAAAHRDLLFQYSRWYSSVPPPLAALHVLAGSTLFAPLVAQRWARRAATPSAAGVKRRRAAEAEAEAEAGAEAEEAPCDRVGRAVAARVPAEMDLLDDDYAARFAAWMRCGGGGGLGNHQHGGNVGGGCDEGALAATVSWLRRRRRTMTLKELDAFARKKL